MEMVYLLCSRCSRRREYHLIIILAIILVFLYTYLYNIHVGSTRDVQADELYGADRRVLPDTREINDDNKKLQVTDDRLDDKPPKVVYKESQPAFNVDNKLQVDEVKSNQVGDEVQDDDGKPQIANKLNSKLLIRQISRLVTSTKMKPKLMTSWR